MERGPASTEVATDRDDEGGFCSEEKKCYGECEEKREMKRMKKKKKWLVNVGEMKRQEHKTLCCLVMDSQKKFLSLFLSKKKNTSRLPH